MLARLNREIRSWTSISFITLDSHIGLVTAYLEKYAKGGVVSIVPEL